MAPTAIILRVLIANMTLKNLAYFKPRNFKILRNEMNEKAGFEIILKRWEHVTYATVRSISMIIISMIINQNFGNTSQSNAVCCLKNR